MSLTGSRFSSDSGTKALPSWDSKTRWNNLWRDLAVEVTAGSSGHTNSPHPSSREGHHSTLGWISGFLLFDLILYSCHAAATSLVHRKSVPSTQMRCMITASRRASATMAFFMPRCLAIFIAHAFQDHFAHALTLPTQNAAAQFTEKKVSDGDAVIDRKKWLARRAGRANNSRP
jgi:hypothetical protein